MKRINQWTVILSALSLLSFALASYALAAVPQKLAYSGYLADGEQPANMEATVTFEIYDTEVDGTPVWFEMHHSVVVDDGHFTAVLGNNSSLQGIFAMAGPFWLQVSIGEQALLPRTPLVSVPFALYAQSSEALGNLQEADVQPKLSDHNMCAEGYFLRGWDDSLGAPICNEDRMSSAQGGIFSITATPPLTGGGNTQDLTLGIAVGSGTNQVAAGDHNHNAEYYTQGQLQTSGQAAVHWNNLEQIPGDLADGDDTGVSRIYPGAAILVDDTRPDAPLVSVDMSLVQPKLSQACIDKSFVESIDPDTGNVSCKFTPDTLRDLSCNNGQVAVFNSSWRCSNIPGTSTPGLVTVAPSGGDYTTIQGAIDAITPSADNPYVIQVRPGTYNEAPIFKSHITVRGAGKDATTILLSGMIEMDQLSNVAISDLTLDGSDVSAPVAILDNGSSPTIEHIRLFRTTSIQSIASSPKILNNEFVMVYPRVLQLNDVTNAAIAGNDYQGGGGTGLQCNNSSAVVENNRFDINPIDARDCVLKFTGNTFSDLIECQSNCHMSFVGNDFYFAQYIEINGSDSMTQFVGNSLTGTVVTINNGEGMIVSNHFHGGYAGGVVVIDGAQAIVANNHIIASDDTAIFNDGGDARIIGNTIIDPEIGIRDHGTAEIVSNRIIDANSQAIELLPTSTSVVWGNHITGTVKGTDPGAHLLTHRDIVIESSASSAQFKAGGSIITLQSNGNIAISAGNQLKFVANGKITLQGDTVEIESTTTDGTGVKIDSATSVDVDGATILLN